MIPVTVRNVRIGEGTPRICVPVVGCDREEILTQAKQLRALPVDLVEWRGDWFSDIDCPEKVREVLAALRAILGETPLLFTFRTKQEGGERELDAAAYEAINRAVIETGYADMVDVELFLGEDAVVKRLIAAAHEGDVKVIASNHDFEKTPPKEEILSRLWKMQEAGADIVKIAVMPQTKQDVLTLLAATEEMCRLYADRPVVTMSMSGDGLISRLCGEIFGSAITFGSAGKASAPGQMDVVQLREVLDILHHHLL